MLMSDTVKLVRSEKRQKRKEQKNTVVTKRRELQRKHESKERM